jgi:hypothetical protein
MRPSKWLTCANPGKMLEVLRERTDSRKLRLFACACCWDVAHLLRDEECKAALLAAERFADGLGSEAELQVARQQAEPATALAWSLWDEGTPQAQEAAVAAAGSDAMEAALRAAEYAAAAAQAEAQDAAGGKGQQRRQADLLRDIFGSPFSVDRAEATPMMGTDGNVRSIARSIYEERQWQDLAVLADALEDANCRDETVLNHLREPGLHARGCWVLDLLLEKR